MQVLTEEKICLDAKTKLNFLFGGSHVKKYKINDKDKRESM